LGVRIDEKSRQLADKSGVGQARLPWCSDDIMALVCIVLSKTISELRLAVEGIDLYWGY
jgi:hypothetical protein